MAMPQQLVKLKDLGLDLIHCTRQPGSLRISSYACALRYLLAQKKNRKIPNDEFGLALKSGLEICRTCPEGRIYSEAFNKSSRVPGKKNLVAMVHPKANAFLGQRERR